MVRALEQNDLLTPEARAVQALFSILDKQGQSVPFILNPSQAAYDRQRTNRDIIAKARQKGFSSYGVALQCIKCLGVPGTRAVLISHEAGATQRLLDRAQYYLKHMNGPKPVLGRNSRNELYFPKTESTYYIGTAGAKAFGRGDTITDLHISEYAWWEGEGLRHIAGILQAVPMSGSVRVESTGNGRANDFYYMCTHPELLGYNLFTRFWWEDDEYSMPVPERGFNPEGFEEYFSDMQLRYNLTEEQMYWYWLKLLEFRGSLETMQQEYPSSLEECFQATGGSVFKTVPTDVDHTWTWESLHGYRIEHLPEHPKKDHTYVIGMDPSGGTGNDESALQIICLDTLQQVLEFHDKHIDPLDFARLGIELARKYNTAYIICERNNHGIACHSILTKDYPTTHLYKEHVPKTGKIKYGILTSDATKPGTIGKIKEAFDLGLVLYGKATIQELQFFFEDSKTHVMSGPSDNLVLSLGMACVGVFKYLRKRKDLTPPPPPTVRQKGVITFEEIFKKRQQKQSILPACTA